jgi:hypothetical protein
MEFCFDCLPLSSLRNAQGSTRGLDDMNSPNLGIMQ